MDFIANIEEIRKRARRHIEEGAFTKDYALDRDPVVRILNDALATEYMCVLRYRFHYFMATGIHSASVAKEFFQHAQEEQDHADQLAERIKQLGGKPELHPSVIAERSHSEYREGTSLADMIREDLIAERIAIETYREMVRYFGDKDTTSRVMMEGILAKEEEHADELADLLFAVQPDTNQGSRHLYFSDETPGRTEREQVGS
ncbi:ferritin-like domain-containing protein [Nitrospira sp. BLG_2]|uniref:ferritin-like domain-containing protein n=1 Tax=Nitrospira sp. BLG_2 TaxID=3397507 RepID=UPI003B98FF7E